jgi:glutathione synthase/RimK-type ligase-like ATP-grasp enzyme
MGLEIAGIDLLFEQEGFLVCDVNASPGLRYLHERQMDAAAAIVRYAEQKVEAQLVY